MACALALIPLVEIGRLRNGRPLYLPAPELDFLMSCGTPRDTLDALDALVADQQRVWDAILTGVTRPFEQRELTWFGELLRWS